MRQTTIVIGASRGIGLAIIRQLGLDGYCVVVFVTKPREDCMEYLRMLQEAGIDYWYIQGSLEKTGDRRGLVDETVAHYSCTNVLVNDTGVALPVRADLLEMTEKSYDRVMNINTRGTMFLTQLVIKQILKQEVIGKKRGTIVNVGSYSAEVSSTSRGEYCISKSTVSVITTLFADRLAGEGILVHEVRPGAIKTDMTSRVQEKYDSLIGNRSFPIRRWGIPRGVTDAVSVFRSDKFLYTTENHIDIDDGFHIKRLQGLWRDRDEKR